MYNSSSTYTIVGNGLDSSSSDATQTYNAYSGEVTITSTASGYIGYLVITMVDLSATPVSMEISYLTTGAGSQTTAGNGTYYTTNAKKIYKVGEEFDPSGICALVTFNDSTTSGYVYTSSELSFSGYSSTAGTKTITVTYTRGNAKLTKTYTVYVISQTPSIQNNVIQISVDKTYSGTPGTIVNGYNMFTSIVDALQYLKNYESQYSSYQKLLVLSAGTYNEKIEVEIPNLTIKGASKETTIIEYDSLYGLKDPNGFTQVTDSTQTMAIRESAKNFTLYEVTVSNWWNSEERFQSKLDFFIGLNDPAFYRNGKIAEHRALAMLIQADQVVIQNCKLLGYQDTLEGFTGRSIFVNTYISGATDFIFGTNATMYFKNCEIHSIYNGSTDGGYINAFKGCNKGSSDYIAYGAIYDGCSFTADEKVTSANTAIARPWSYYSNIMIMNSTLGGHISTSEYTSGTTKNQRYVCWTSNGSVAAEPTSSTVKFLEYNNTGAGAMSASGSGFTVLTNQEEALKYADYSSIFGSHNGLIKYSSAWIPTLIEEGTQAQTYTIEFDTQGGNTIEAVNVEEGSLLMAPSNPTKSGYEFDGWYLDSNCTSVYSFNSPVVSSFTLYAKWIAEVIDEFTLTSIAGYTEGIYATFEESNVSKASVYYSLDDKTWNKVDSELLRQISSNEARVDVIGLETGIYSLKVLNSAGETAIVNNIYVAEDDRSGYAHFNNTTGVGAYNNNGTLKSNAVVVYVTEATKNTVTASLGGKTYTGLVNIIQACTKSNYALDIRIIGKISTPQWNSIKYSGNPMTEYGGLPVVKSDGTLDKTNVITNALGTYAEIVAAGVNSMSDDLQEGMTILNGLTNKVLSGFDSYFNMCDVNDGYNITVEGIGTDAEIFQWGFEFKKCNSIEVKNLTFSDYTEDAVGFEGSSGAISKYGNYWVHNCVFNVGVNNWDVCDDQDKADGDGSTDVKYCHDVTISYTKYNSTHKTNLIGANKDSKQYNITLHHNFYNMASQRLPLVRQSNIHMYNNYYLGDSNSYSGISIRSNAYAFIENCYFESVSNPIELRDDDSNASYLGNAFKALGNTFVSCSATQKTSSGKRQNGYMKNNVTSRTESVKNSCKADGSTDYSGYDTNPELFYYDSTNNVSNVMLLESALDAKNTVMEYAGVLKSNTSGGPIDSGVLYTVSFESNGGTAVSEMIVKEGKTINLPTTTKSGYKLEGWYTDSSMTSEFTSQTAVTSNLTLYAKWVESITYTVAFEVNGGESVSSINVVEGNTITLPANPTKDGYTFGGWYTDSALTTKFDASTIISNNLTLYAKWIDSALTIVHNFTTDGKTSDVFTITGNLSTSKGSATYNDLTLTQCLKLESSTSISFTLSSDMTIVLVLGNAGVYSGQTIKINGTTYTSDNNGIVTVELTAGEYSITKAGTTNLFYISLS